MSEHDLLQQGPRLRRLAISLFASVAVGAIFWSVAWAVIESGPSTKTTGMGALNAAYYFAALGAGAAFILIGVLLKRRDDRRWAQPAKATALERRQ